MSVENIKEPNTIEEDLERAKRNAVFFMKKWEAALEEIDKLRDQLAVSRRACKLLSEMFPIGSLDRESAMQIVKTARAAKEKT